MKIITKQLKDNKEYLIGIDYAGLSCKDNTFVTYFSQNEDGSLKYEGNSSLEDLPEWHKDQIMREFIESK